MPSSSKQLGRQTKKNSAETFWASKRHGSLWSCAFVRLLSSCIIETSLPAVLAPAMVVNVMVVYALIVTQSADRSVIYFATVLANEIYNTQAPAIGFNVMVVYALIVTQSEDSFVVCFATVLRNGILIYIAPAMFVKIIAV
jgi:hypothetical protein